MNTNAVETKTSRKVETPILRVVNMAGKLVGDYKLDSFVFDGRLNQDLLHQAITIYRANQRKGLANTKTRGEVSGGGRKPWRQKGTGRARVCSIRSPLWRGGGISFGPKPHSFRKELPKKMKALAVKSALNAKYKADAIVILEQLRLESHKTKGFISILRNLGLVNAKVRFVVEAIESNVKYASANIADVCLSRSQDVHAAELIDCKKLVFTRDALRMLEERVKKCLQR